MTAFNPNSPSTLGPEWAPSIRAAVGLKSAGISGAFLLHAQATETIDALYVYLSAVANLDDDRGSGWEVEVYQAADLGVLGRSVTEHVPTATVFNRDAFAWGAFAPSGTPPGSLDLHLGIDSYPSQLYAGKGTWPNSGQPVDNDEFLFPIYGLGCEAAFRFTGIQGTLTGKRITRVKLAAYVQEYVAKGVQNAGCQITPFLVIDGQRVNGETETKSGERAGGHYLEVSWWVNPVTKGSWTVDDVEEFDAAGGTSAAGWSIAPTGSANDLPAILQGWFVIETTDELTDPREAVGVLTDSDARLGWNRISLAAPGGGAWAKTQGTTYLVLMRRRYGKGSVSWRYLDSGSVPPVEHLTPADVTISPDTGFPAGWSTAGQTKLPAFLLSTSGGTTSVDSQPYAHAGGDEIAALGVDAQWTTVDASQEVWQEFTTVGAGDYTWVRALVRLPGLDADAPLTIRLTDGAGVQTGPTLTVQPSDLVEPRNAWQIIEGQFGGTVGAATQRQIRCGSTATPGSGWQVQVLSTQLVGTLGGPPSDVGVASFDGTTDAAWIGGVRRVELDACVVAQTQPDAPQGFSAAPVGETDCIDGIMLSWTPTTLGSEFLRYEIDRNDDGEWRRIAEITTESVDALTDWESVRNAPAAYRMRVRRADNAPSVWTDEATATATMGCCGYVLASNLEPALNMWADDAVDGEREYDFNADDEVRFFQGRDYPVVFSGLERRGVSFDTTLLLAAEGGRGGTDAATTPGLSEFDRLRAFTTAESGAGLPYVAVLTRDGDRIFASLTIKKGLRQEPGGAYSVTVTVREVGVVPTPVDVTP